MSFAVLLLPQRTGRLLFPSISITPLPLGSKSREEQSDGAETTELIRCEIDYVSQAETIYVVPDTSRTTVNLDLRNVSGKPTV